MEFVFSLPTWGLRAAPHLSFAAEPPPPSPPPPCQSVGQIGRWAADGSSPTSTTFDFSNSDSSTSFDRELAVVSSADAHARARCSGSRHALSLTFSLVCPLAPQVCASPPALAREPAHRRPTSFDGQLYKMFYLVVTYNAAPAATTAAAPPTNSLAAAALVRIQRRR